MTQSVPPADDSAGGAPLPVRRNAPVRDVSVAPRAYRRDELGYPEALRERSDAPGTLWVAGSLDALQQPTVAIVGTRDATPYGLRVARQIAECLANAGVTVLSGLARGIDAVAHRAALDAGGHTIAILGTGVDVAYPKPHRALQQAIADRGALISEWPPGTGGAPWHFPRRNRMIAALAQVTLVIEAGVKSGALITADLAIEMDRTVAAVPGPIDAPQSGGTNRLIRDGAQVITCVDDALTLLGRSRATPAHTPPSLTPHAAAIWEALGQSALDLDGLIARTGLSAQHAAVAVTQLELQGRIESDWNGVLRRRL